MKSLFTLATSALVLLALGGLFFAYNRSESFDLDDQPIKALEP
jgi:hypothetical protein